VSPAAMTAASGRSVSTATNHAQQSTRTIALTREGAPPARSQCHGSSREDRLLLPRGAVAPSRGYCFQSKESPAGSAAAVAKQESLADGPRRQSRSPGWRCRRSDEAAAYTRFL